MFPRARFRLSVISECGSTQDAVFAKRGTEDFHGAAILALRQTAGRGRRGRSWQSPEGNLALSIGLEIGHDEALPLLPFACGLALRDATALFLPAKARLRLKWPNDLYLEGKKLAGLVAQARQAPGRGSDVVVGVGLNLRESPAGLDQEAIALSALAPPPPPETLARAFLAALEMVFREREDFSSLRSAWESAAEVPGAALFVVGESGSVRPLALLPTGELLVTQSEDGRERRLSSEEISLRLGPVMTPSP